MQDVIKQIEAFLTDPGKSIIVSYVAEVVSALGLFVGIFDHSLGLKISTAPQSVLISISLVVVGALSIWRMIHKQKIAQIKTAALQAALVYQAHIDALNKAA